MKLQRYNKKTILKPRTEHPWEARAVFNGAALYHNRLFHLFLLRGPTYPDPNADQGEHHFTYSLLPHRGDWRTGTVPAAYALNDPLIVRRVNGVGISHSMIRSLVAVDSPNVVIETVKQAEDGQGVIVRLYECQRQRGHVTLTTDFSLAKAWRTNLLEENQEQVEVNGRSLRVAIEPYQILTFRLLPDHRRVT